MSEFLRKMLAEAKLKVDKMEQCIEPENVSDTTPNSDIDIIPDSEPIPDIVTTSDQLPLPDMPCQSDRLSISDIVTRPDISSVSDIDQPRNKRQKTPSYFIVPFKVKKKLPKLPPSGLLLYVYLHKLAFKRNNPSGIIEYNQREIMTALDFPSPSTIVGAMAALEKHNLISWEEKSHKRGKKSKIRVTPTPDLLGKRYKPPTTTRPE